MAAPATENEHKLKCHILLPYELIKQMLAIYQIAGE